MFNLMKQNAGMLDRGVRVLLGLGLLAMTLSGPEIAWGWIGVVPLLTGIFGSCPVYSLLGVSTCPAKKPTQVS